jgi:5-methyltetrahydropteroyltriglutamate--homocysteine methyltransferase
LPLLREALERVVAPLRGRSRVWVYLGYPDLETVGAELAILPVNGLLVAGAHCAYEGFAAFARALPADRAVGIGVIDAIDPRVETVDEVRERLTIVSGLVAPDRLWAVPDAGLRALPPEIAEAKLAAMVAAAK